MDYKKVGAVVASHLVGLACNRANRPLTTIEEDNIESRCAIVQIHGWKAMTQMN